MGNHAKEKPDTLSLDRPKGLRLVEQLYGDRAARAKDLKSQGKKVIGYLCCYGTPELVTAAGLVPFRIMGDSGEMITEANSRVEAILCPFIRSCFDIALKGTYDFLDGFICPHSCDNVTNIYEIWKHHLNPHYSHFLNVPHTQSDASVRFLEAELGTLKRSLETLTGNEISQESLEAAIRLHNLNRSLVRELYELRKPDPPLLLGSELMKTVVVVLSLPAGEANDLLKDVLQEAKTRPSRPKKAPRILLFGPELDGPVFCRMVEESGANIVADDVCLGSRPFRQDVRLDDNPLSSLAEYYLKQITCPRTCNSVTDSWEQEIEDRFGYLRKIAEEYRVDGVIFYDMKYCDIFGFQAPDVKDYLEKAGFPLLHIEGEYSAGSILRLKTMVEAFLEMIGGK